MNYTLTILFVNRLLLIVVAISGVLLLARGALRATLEGPAAWLYGACVVLSVLYLLLFRRAPAGTARAFGIAANCMLLIAFTRQLLLARYVESLTMLLALFGLVVVFVGVPLGLMVTGKAARTAN